MNIKIKNFIDSHPRLKRINDNINKIWADDIFGLSAELTFYLTLAFFPFLILLLALISVTPLSAEETLFPLLSTLPGEVYDVTIYVLTGVRRSTTFIISSGLVALWSFSCAVKTISKAFNRMYKTIESRNFIVIRSIGFLFGILLACIIILTFFFLVLGDLIGVAISNFLPSFHTVWHILRLVIVYASLFFSFAFIYKFLPDKKIRLKSVITGSAFSTFAWGLSSTIFSFYANNFAKYHIIYGSLAGIAVLISWLYMTSILIFIGGEINSIKHISGHEKF